MRGAMACKLLGALVAGIFSALAPAFAQNPGEEAAKAFEERADAFFKQGRYAEALAASEERVKAAEKSQSAGPGAAADALNNVAWHALFARRFSRALAASERALALQPDTLVFETNRAHALLFLGRTKQALAVYTAHKGEGLADDTWEDVILKDFADFRQGGLLHPLYRQVERVMAAAPVSNSPEVLDHKAHRLAKAGKYAEATPLAERYLAKIKSGYGTEHPKYAKALDSLASRYMDQGRDAEAEPLKKQTLALRERVLGPEHIDTLVSMNNLAHLYNAQGRYAEAEPLQKRVLESAGRVLGADHWLTLTAAGNLAVTLDKQGRYKEAEPLLRRALSERKRKLGEDHRDTLQTMHNLAACYEAQGRFQDAEALFKRSLEGKERVLGKEHPETLVTASSLASLYGELGRYQEAERIHLKTVEARERLLGKEHPDTLMSLNNLAHLYAEQGRNAEAEPVYRRVLEAHERILGRDHPSTLVSVNNLGALYSHQGRYAEAGELYRRALEARERVLGKDNPDTLTSLNNLAHLYSEMGRYAEAEQLDRQVLETRERVLGAEHPETLTSLNNLGAVLQSQGRYAEAELLVKHVLEATERRLGPQHPDTLSRVNNLASLYDEQGRYAEAEPLLRRALDSSEQTLGAEHPGTLRRVNNLASLLIDAGRFFEAEPLYQRALQSRERTLGREHVDTLISVNNLALLYGKLGRYAEAEQLYKRSLEALERVVGPEHPNTLLAMGNLAVLYDHEGRYAEAEELQKKTVQASERVLGKEHPETLTRISNLALVYRDEGRYAEAEVLARRVLDAQERILGLEHPRTLNAINNLAVIYDDQERYADAEAFYRRALDGAERTLGMEHPFTVGTASNLATALWNEKKYAEAEPLNVRALEVRERVFGKEHPDTLFSVHNLAALYSKQERYADAERLAKRAVETASRVLGPEHPVTLTTLINLGDAYQGWGRYAEAEPLYKRVFESRERVLGADHPDTLGALRVLALLYFEQKDYGRALDYWRRAAAGYAGRTLRGLRDGGAGKKQAAGERASSQFWSLVKAAWRAGPEGTPPDTALTAETFEAAQWVQSSEAAQSLAQMAARGGAANPELAGLARERQDLLLEWQKRDALRDAALGKPASKRDAQGEAENAARLAAIGERLAGLDARLKTDFPEFAALASPAPLPLAEAQGLLADGEALVLFLDTPEKKPAPEETFIWVATKTQTRWIRSELGKDALTREVQALRCGLDAAAWTGPACAELTGQHYSVADAAAGALPPFDAARAHKLYQALFGQAEDLIGGKQLLLVPSGVLSQLPFQVLVTAVPREGDAPAWLIRDHALSVLPAVSSLKALRRLAGASKAGKPMTGFGNPLLDGPDERYSALAAEARSKDTCTPSKERQASAPPAPAPAPRGGLPQLATRGGLADPAVLRQATPLPETADELCSVAAGLGAAPDEIYLGARATEAQVKRLSQSGALARYRIVHFATHGALAGQVKGMAEPGLLLTPPDTSGELDDGYLTASEIAGLKLDADWAILSACNTAAAGAQNAEALSGLARAFIYAQTRALLVSHWEVNSDATVKLITGAMDRLAADKTMGRAEAMRQSMLALIGDGTPREQHPATWAPFVVAGEGSGR